MILPPLDEFKALKYFEIKSFLKKNGFQFRNQDQQESLMFKPWFKPWAPQLWFDASENVKNYWF